MKPNNLRSHLQPSINKINDHSATRAEGWPDYLACWRSGRPADDARFKAAFQRHAPTLSFEYLPLAGERQIAPAARVQYVWCVSGQISIELTGSWHTETHRHVDDRQQYELRSGDVVVASPAVSARLWGQGAIWSIASECSVEPPFVGLKRLEALPDTSGGCNVGAQAFRRLQLTWEPSPAAEDADGRNVLGCHVVWIAADTSRAHYHPVPPIGGGALQNELYLVLDPAEHGLRPGALTPGVWTYPDPGNWGCRDFTPLQPGDVLLMPAGIAHRAVDVLACVIAIPGFKPGNEIYVDADIAAWTARQTSTDQDVRKGIHP